MNKSQSIEAVFCALVWSFGLQAQDNEDSYQWIEADLRNGLEL